MIGLAVLVERRLVTDGRTDRHTMMMIYRAEIASRGKNALVNIRHDTMRQCFTAVFKFVRAELKSNFVNVKQFCLVHVTNSDMRLN